ncbi:MAG: amidohydrolase [Deltaproteobacteria bacterium]|nr:amidohydrolase [Deltaproteobacteria bacterium]
MHRFALALPLLFLLSSAETARAEAGAALDAGRSLPDAPLTVRIPAGVARAEARMIETRRDLHAHPELGFAEKRTAALVAKRLRTLGLAVREGVGGTGVVGVLRGAKPGRTVALRADMDALPVTEQTGLPFASKAKATWRGETVGVMHACGHDAHVAMLLGAAEVLAGLRDGLPGEVVFLFQPAEEGGGPGETGGAEAMLAEGAFDDPSPAAIFGLHVGPVDVAGELSVVAGPAMAASDRFRIVVRGRQTHGALPFAGIDPIPVAARIVLAIEALPAREIDVTTPAIVSVGAIHGGNRNNILPDEVELIGTIRSFDEAARTALHAKIERVAAKTAEASGATATVEIVRGYGVLVNDAELAAFGRRVLERSLGADRVHTGRPTTTAEDFSFYANRVPGLFLWLGVRDPATPIEAAAPNHSPRFLIDERGLATGVRALVELAVAFNGRDS